MTDLSETSTSPRGLASDAVSGAGDSSDDDRTLAADEQSASPGEQRTLARAELVGRYVVLSRLGAGAMGVVYAAFDPDLDRKVALKLLLSGHGGTAAARLLREAQALARLAHPNVVAVHDVGLHEGSVFVAMEFVDGQTLRDLWDADAPSWTDVLDTMRQAGRGLEAAHARGLVHRDFKPDNVMVGDDGQRIRVLDFGLARLDADESMSKELANDPALDDVVGSDASTGSDALTALGAAPGTPAYMAAEQWAGKSATPASDQFALCVTIWEGLYGTRPFTSSTRRGLQTAIETESITEPEGGRDVPAWIRRVLERGLSADPRKRWRSVAALLEALDDGRRQADRRRSRIGLAVGGALLLGGAGLWIGLDAQERAGCRARADEVDELWNDEVRANATKAMTEALPSYGPQAMRSVVRYVDEWTEGWREGQYEVCRSLDETLQARAAVCLEEQRALMAVFTEKLQDPVPLFGYAAVITASSLANPRSCADPDHLRQQPDVRADSTELMAELYRDIAKANAANWGADPETAIATMRGAIDKAKDLDHLAMRARLYRILGDALAAAAKFEEAERALVEAYRLAGRAGNDGLVALAADSLATMLSDELRKIGQARIWLEVADVAFERLGDDSSLDYADHVATVALVENAAENYDEALVAFEELRRLRTNHLGADHPNVAVTIADTALVYVSSGRSKEAVESLEQANAALEAAVGENHPILATTYNTLAIALLKLDRPQEAVDVARHALEVSVAAREPGHTEIAMCRTTLGFALHENGQEEEALEVSLVALQGFEAAFGSRHPHVGVVNANIGEVYFQLGKLDLARRHFQVGLEIARAHDDAEAVAGLRMRFAQILAAEGKIEEARTDMLAALEALHATGNEEAAVEGQVALANLELDDGRPDAALELARTAWISKDATEEDRLAAALAFARALSEGPKPDRERATRVAREALGRNKEFPELVELAEYARLERWLTDQNASGADPED